MRYRSKPVVIEAIAFLGPFSVDEMRVFWGEPFAAVCFYDPVTNDLRIRTPEGDMTANLQDMIIKGTHGEFYPCKPDVFAVKYEPATRGGS
jgi:hypothetical protein